MPKNNGCDSGSCSSCQQGCESGCGQAPGDARAIKKKILVMSGKGGVGKSSMAVNLAVWLNQRQHKVGLLDIDIHGPSVPKLLDIENQRPVQFGDQFVPVAYKNSMKVMSIGFFLENDSTPVIWRGPAKHGFIKQFVENVCWEDTDYLVVDCPPGTGDEMLAIAQLLGPIDGAVIITTPQDIALIDVKKCLSFCNQLEIPVVGIIENMSGLVCPHCTGKIDVFNRGGGEKLAREFNVPFLGGIPLDPEVARTSDLGKPVIEMDKDHPTVQAMSHAYAEAMKNKSLAI